MTATSVSLTRKLLQQATAKASTHFPDRDNMSQEERDEAAEAAADAFIAELREHSETLWITEQCGTRRAVINIFQTARDQANFEHVLNNWAIRD